MPNLPSNTILVPGLTAKAPPKPNASASQQLRIALSDNRATHMLKGK